MIIIYEKWGSFATAGSQTLIITRGGRSIMKTLNCNEKKVMNGSFYLLAVIFMLAMFVGCAGGNYGKVVWDRDLNNTFESYQVLPDHRYYVTGGYEAPAGIIAIHKDYQLDNGANMWVLVPNVGSGQMQRWVENLSDDVMFWNSPKFTAAYIIDPEGKRVGAWYSGQRNATIKFLEGNRIKVFPPNLKPSFGGDRRGGDLKP